MKTSQILHQTPRPEVKIYDPLSGDLKMEFDASHAKGLLEYSFKTSVDDAKGHFSLTFYPDEDGGGTPVFDAIKLLDVVEIYERKNPVKEGGGAGVNFDSQYGAQRQAERETPLPAGSYAAKSRPAPDFTGVVRGKKFASQIGGTSATRKMAVTGHSAAGLVSEFYLTMDTTAMVITEATAAQEAVRTSLTIAIAEGGTKLEDAVKTIWNEFEKLSRQHGRITNPEIYEILTKWTDGSFFDIDGTITLHYPLSCVFDAKSTKSFFDLVEGIVPSQAYEKFAYMDRAKGVMRIKIRECPFDAEDWKNARSPDCYSIPMRLVKSVNLEQNDNEVYTVFFSYLDGYPCEMNFLLRLSKASQGGGSNPSLVWDDGKYSRYGYRPLFVTFKGYRDEDGTAGEKLAKLNQRLKDWYGNLELMYNGQITLATDLSVSMPQAGETIAFLGGEFYVSAAEHRWSYKGNPETVLTVSRGGVYEPKISGYKKISVNDEPAKGIKTDVEGSMKLEFSELKYWGRKKEAGNAGP